MGLVGCLARVELYWGLNDVHVDLNVLVTQCGSIKAKLTSKRNQSTYRASACTTCRYDHTNHHHLHIISLFSPSTSSVESNARTWTSQKILSATPPMLTVRCEVVNIQGLTPSVKAVWTAIQQVERSKEGVAIPRSGYHRCGRRPKLSKVPGLGDIHHRQAGPAMPGRATGPAGARPG